MIRPFPLAPRALVSLSLAAAFVASATPVRAQQPAATDVQRTAQHDFRVVTVAEGLVGP